MAQEGHAIELGAGVVAAFARDRFAGAGLSIARRVGRQRVMLSAAAGTLGDRRAGRGELSVQYLLNADARSGLTLYGALGAACVVRDGSPVAGYLLLLLGAERAAARPLGWYAEVGLGGGLRLAAGMRLRRFGAR